MGLDDRGLLFYAFLMAKIKGAECASEDIQKLPFEEALKKLEAIVEAMEAQDLPLESLLAAPQDR